MGSGASGEKEGGLKREKADECLPCFSLRQYDLDQVQRVLSQFQHWNAPKANPNIVGLEVRLK
ncbi:hypothetical protein DC20_19590 [Rufibacter tibetensis]|uniref:Uncharacterized protein n=1 Tax=Rufibacter tibetensis TaxID=512763 RepID=A0A0N7HX15_9BACT|nr:hypothetical protein DC20_19590 [Rufibacter tibetensis]